MKTNNILNKCMKIYLFKNEEIENAYAYLNQDDLNYLRKFHYRIKTKKINSILLQKYVIMLNFNLKPMDIIIRRKYGKPYFREGFFYSVSYSNDYIIIVTSNNNIGIDIEYINHKLNNVLYNIFFDETFKNSSSENNTLLWTKIESYLKLIGCGLKGLNILNYYKNNIYHNGKKIVFQDISYLLPKYYYGCISGKCSEEIVFNEVSSKELITTFEL